MCSGSAGVAAAGAGALATRCGGGGIPDALIGRDIWRVAQIIVKGYGKDAAIPPPLDSHSSTGCSLASSPNKRELLLVLDRPEIPLHTNGSENDIRCQVTRRKLSGGTRSDTGRDCRDAFLSLAKTAASSASSSGTISAIARCPKPQRGSLSPQPRQASLPVRLTARTFAPLTKQTITG